MRSFLSFWRHHPHVAAIGIITAATAARYLFVASGQLDLVQDEAQYWDWSRNLQLSYYSKGPLIAWIIAFFTGIFGNTELGVRFGAVVGSVVAQGILYAGLAGLMKKPRLAVISLCILNTMPLFLASGILMTTDNPLLVCWLGAFFCLHATVDRPESSWPWYGLGAAVAIGILAKYTMLGMLGVAVLHGLILTWQGVLPSGHWWRLALSMGVGVCLGMLPIAVWNAGNDWVSFRHVGRLAGVAPALTDAKAFIRFDRLPEYVGGQLGLVYPWWLAFMLYGGWKALGLCLRRASGTAWRDRRDHAFAALLCAGFWPIFLFFLVWSLHTRIYANWPAMCYASGVILAAWGVDRVLEKYRSAADLWSRSREGHPLPWTRRLLPVWVGISLLFCGIMYAQEPLSRLLPESLNPTARLKGWEDLGNRVGALRDKLPDPSRVFIFSDAYDVTAELAFYVPGNPRVYCADFGRRLSQYDFWPVPEGMQGWNAIFVRRKPFADPPAPLGSMFLRLGAPQVFRSTHRGGPGRTFGLMVLEDFTGEWPRVSKGIY